MHLVGTGLVEGNLDYGNDFVALERYFAEIFGNPPVLRTRSDAGGNWELFLGPEIQVHIATFDPDALNKLVVRCIDKVERNESKGIILAST